MSLPAQLSEPAGLWTCPCPYKYSTSVKRTNFVDGAGLCVRVFFTGVGAGDDAEERRDGAERESDGGQEE